MTQIADARQVIEAQLVPGERLLWAGRPGRGLPFGAQNVALLLAPLLVIILAILVALALNGPPSDLWQLLAFAFAGPLLGGAVVIGARVVVIASRRQAVYGLTDNRIVIVTKGSIRSLPLRTLADFALTDGQDGRGTITLRPPVSSMQVPPALEVIDDARRVYAMIQGAQAALAPPAHRGDDS